MDAFAKNKYLFWSVILLIILNIFLLGFIWRTNQRFTPPDFPHRREITDFPKQKFNDHLERFLINELNLDENQQKEFHLNLKNHFSNLDSIMAQIRNLKSELIQQVFNEKPDYSVINNLSDEIGKLNAKLDKMNVNHFLEIKKILNKEQFEKFRNIISDIFVNAPFKNREHHFEEGEFREEHNYENMNPRMEFDKHSGRN